MRHPIRLGINIDHVATLRNARGGTHPEPLIAAQIASKAGADSITVHLREDRRHIRDEDVIKIRQSIARPMNLEMAATQEMLEIALKVKPHAVCIVPEKRQELTTEGGLDVLSQKDYLKAYIDKMQQAGIKISLFINPELSQLEASAYVGANAVELHTGKYAEEHNAQAELLRLKKAAEATPNLQLECHAGHGLNFANVAAIAAIPEIKELNIGHFIIGQALFDGLEKVILHMRTLIDEARSTEIWL